MATPGEVVDRDDQPAPAGRASGLGAASVTECTTSNPRGAWHTPWSHARVTMGPGSRDTITGLPKRANGSLRRMGRAGA